MANNKRMCSFSDYEITKSSDSQIQGNRALTLL
jgi:hypothetical protein